MASGSDASRVTRLSLKDSARERKLEILIFYLRSFCSVSKHHYKNIFVRFTVSHDKTISPKRWCNGWRVCDFFFKPTFKTLMSFEGIWFLFLTRGQHELCHLRFGCMTSWKKDLHVLFSNSFVSPSNFNTDQWSTSSS